jgi:endoglucanase
MRIRNIYGRLIPNFNFSVLSLLNFYRAFGVKVIKEMTSWCAQLRQQQVIAVLTSSKGRRTPGRLWISAVVIFLLISLSSHPQSLIGVANAASVPYTGVNLAGADFGEGSLPGTYNIDYTYPTAAEVDYFLSKGMTTFRLPFRWERLQRQQFGNFDADEQARINEFVSYATSKGAFVLLDPHNYARYYGQVIGQGVPVTAFNDFWTKLANLYKSNRRVIFGLMNEPNNMPTELWRDDANSAIQAIRRTGATNLILVPGNAWTGAHSWNQSWYGTPNATAMLDIIDPINNYAFEVHQYMDGDFSGTSDQCISRTIGAEKLVEFTEWLKENGKRGFLGEFGGGRNNTCYDGLDNMLSYIHSNTDVWLGWTYWAAGPWWGEYRFTLQPINGADRPQMVPLSKYLGSTPSPQPTTTPSPQPTTTPSPQPTTTPSPQPTTTPSPQPTTTPSPQPTTTPSPQPTTTPSPTNSPASSLQAKIVTQSEWETGFCVNLEVTNVGNTSIQNWQMKFQMSQAQINNNWNFTFTKQGDKYVVTPVQWAKIIQPNQTQGALGFCANKLGSNYKPTQVSATSL